jgi:peptide/nickel transport system ATP-binding protein
VSVVDVVDLRVELAGGEDIVDRISFKVDAGEVVGLVGESGSGKTTVALALLGHARPGTRIAGGSVRVAGQDVLSLRREEIRAARGKLVAYVPQDPSAALNPSLRIGTQLAEVVEVHERGSNAQTVGARLREVLADVRLPSDDDFLRRYPHQLSGGQQQRVCIAMAFILRPRAIVLDEPTTGLDVTTQAHVLETVRDLCRTHDVGAVYVSHDLAAVGSIAHRVLVMYAGRLAESGPTARLFARPGHPYTRKLVAAIPDLAARRRLESIPGQVPAPGRRPGGCVFAPRCPHVIPACTADDPPPLELEPGHAAYCIRALELDRATTTSVLAERVTGGGADDALLVVCDVDASHGVRRVLRGVSLELRPRECLALVGESGSGKTTLARAIVGLHAARTGEIRFKGELLAPRARDRPVDVRRSVQYIFQSPYNSLNPRQAIGEIVRVPIEHFFGLRGQNAAERMHEALERVSLSPRLATAYPDELSGGERQRVAIARALACQPDVLICDEITSALDASVQAAIVRLLEELQDREELALLFVTHNLALVRTIADRVIVLDRGEAVETGATEQVLTRPDHGYTRALIADTPSFASLGRDDA